MILWVANCDAFCRIGNDDHIGVHSSYSLNDTCFLFSDALLKVSGSNIYSASDFIDLRKSINSESYGSKNTLNIYFDSGHDSLQQQYQCDRLIQSGAIEPKILVGGITALPQLLSEDRHELFLSPRQAYPILENGQGIALFIGDVKPHRYSYAFQEGIAREDVIELATEIQAQYKTAAEWRPLLLVGSRQDYYDYLNRVKTPLVGVYFLDGGIEAHKKYLAERKAMLYAKEERKKPTCPMLP